jgi:diacylglycerol kinase (ATP)
VVVGGGDGTIHGAVNALVDASDPGAGRAPVLAVLPLGTANDFARSLGVFELEHALDAVAAARAGRADAVERGARPATGDAGVLAADLLRITLDDGDPELAVNIVVAGFGGRVQQEITPELKARWGPLAYLVGGVEAFDGTGHRATLALDDRAPIEIDFFNLAAANGRYAGGGYEAAPDARIDDGTLELVVASPVDLRGLASLASFLSRGEHPEHDAVTLFGARSAVLETADELDYSLDGEARSGRRAELHVVEGVLPVVVFGTATR